jgi:hypothetical protein
LNRNPYHQDGDSWIELRGKLAGIYQREVGGGARILFRIEAARRTMVIEPFPGHPKQTEKRNR